MGTLCYATFTDGYQSNMKMKRAKAHGAKNKNVLALYNKLTELVDSLAELIDIQELTDTIILQVSTQSIYGVFKPGNGKYASVASCIRTTSLLLSFQMSTLSVAPFFVENISELQLNSLKLVTRVRVLHLTIFHLSASAENTFGI